MPICSAGVEPAYIINLPIPPAYTTVVTNSSPYDVSDATQCSVQASFTSSTGSLTVQGTLAIQASLDGYNWATLNTQTVNITAEDNWLWDMPTKAFRSIRVVFTPTLTNGAIQFTVRATKWVDKDVTSK